MSVRENLLRLHRWRLQERQDYLAGLESLLERLRGDARRLQDETAQAERAIGYPVEGGAIYPLFLRPLIERQRKIERSMLDIETRIVEARDVVAAAVQEVKHAEIGAGPHVAPVPMPVTRRLRRQRQGARATIPLAGDTRTV